MEQGTPTNTRSCCPNFVPLPHRFNSYYYFEQFSLVGAKLVGILWYLRLGCAGVLGLAGLVVPYATGISELQLWTRRDGSGLYSKMLDLAQVVQDPGGAPSEEKIIYHHRCL